MTEALAFEVSLDQPYDEAIAAVTAALKLEGFGILTKIDVKATMKEKLGEDFRPYAILGACNPPLAHRALSYKGEIGVMLPCNVTVEAVPSGGSLVRISDPNVFMQVGSLQHDSTLREIAHEARDRLLRVVQTIQSD